MAEKNDELVTKLLWVDLEMTGLDPETDRILEVAAIVTDFDFNELDRFDMPVYQSDEVLAHMNEWCVVTHTQSGLVERVKQAQPEQEVVKAFISFITTYISDEPVVLAGNNIHQDRRFIRQWWPDVEALLHYRMLDVSSYKLVMVNKYNKVFEKKKTHRALDDIEESIAELKFYLQEPAA
jgi:oligoribonuclease